MQGLRRLVRDLIRANQPTYTTDVSGNTALLLPDGTTSVAGDAALAYRNSEVQSGEVATQPPFSTLTGKSSRKTIPQLVPIDWYPDTILACDSTYLSAIKRWTT